MSFSRETSKRGGIRVKVGKDGETSRQRGGEMGIRRWLREEMVEERAGMRQEWGGIDA